MSRGAFIAVLATSMFIACGEAETGRRASSETAVDAALRQLDEEKRLHEEQDKRDAPFDSKLQVDSLTVVQKMDLCGDDYRKIAVGWPIKKALACAGRDLYVVSDAAGGVRIWQSCDGSGACLTVGEQAGRVANWNR